jgi:hypothetical protein
MTVDLSTQIRDYAAAVDSVQKPMNLDEITRVRLSSEQVRPVSAAARPAEPRPSRAWVAVATAAAGVLVLVGGTAWLTQMTGSDTTVADTAVPTTLAAADTAAQDQDAAASVFGHLLDSYYDHGPGCGNQPCIREGRMEMSDERISGNVTFTQSAEGWDTAGCCGLGTGLFWGTMLIENDGGTWEGTHFMAHHHAQPEREGPVVMQLVGSGEYEGLSAILYRTVITPDADIDREQSVDGMIFPGNLPPDRLPPALVSSYSELDRP